MTHRLLVPLACVAALAASSRAATAQTAEAGSVGFYVTARSDFDPWTSSPTPREQEWMREHYDRMLTYSPYFDSRLEWFPDAWFYENAYAIYPGSDVVVDHPEWILKDGDGRMLYIPYGCSGGTCPQYAGDVGHPGFRRHWIENAARTLAEGYRGIFIDDVNMAWRVSDGNGDRVAPRDPRTGRPMTLADWRRYMAEFLELVRETFPDVEIVHNAIWYAVPTDDPFIARQQRAADYIALERGATDRGIVAGDGRYGFDTFLSYIDRIHASGGRIILADDESEGLRERDYELAVYFLVNQGADLIGADGDRSRMNPDSFWEGYELELGAAMGPRYRTPEGLYSRDFACGRVLVNGPGRRVRTAQVSPTLRTFDEEERTGGRIELEPSSAAILVEEKCLPGA
ncbi:MAG: putative glycoside hydrolase [Longimicrobiales bacterium]|nr:putative glycoside hydrolase [Longimicrobiales bacterium]